MIKRYVLNWEFIAALVLTMFIVPGYNVLVFGAFTASIDLIILGISLYYVRYAKEAFTVGFILSGLVLLNSLSFCIMNNIMLFITLYQFFYTLSIIQEVSRRFKNIEKVI